MDTSMESPSRRRAALCARPLAPGARAMWRALSKPSPRKRGGRLPAQKTSTSERTRAGSVDFRNELAALVRFLSAKLEIKLEIKLELAVPELELKLELASRLPG